MSHTGESVILGWWLNNLNSSPIRTNKWIRLFLTCYSQVWDTATTLGPQQTTLCLKRPHHLPSPFAWPLHQALMTIYRSHHGVRMDLPCCHHHQLFLLLWDFLCSVILGNWDIKFATQPRNHLQICWPSSCLAQEDEAVFIFVSFSFEVNCPGTCTSQLLFYWYGPCFKTGFGRNPDLRTKGQR